MRSGSTSTIRSRNGKQWLVVGLSPIITEGPGTIVGMTSVGIFLKDLNPHLREFRQTMGWCSPASLHPKRVTYRNPETRHSDCVFRQQRHDPPRICPAKGNCQCQILRNYFETFTAANLICTVRRCSGVENSVCCMRMHCHILQSVHATSWSNIIYLLSHIHRTRLIWHLQISFCLLASRESWRAHV